MNMWKRRKRLLAKAKGQGLVEYALLLSLVAIVVIVALALLGDEVRSVYCQISGALPGGGSGCDVVAITKADYDTDDQELHLDATSNGTYDPSITLTASPGGVMQAKHDHYHLKYDLSGCPCTVRVTSSGGGSASVTVGP